MPYKNIIFVKLLWKELLHEDDRFVERLDDSQKGLYLMLLLLAGATNNNIPNSEKYLKRVLNLHEKSEKITENLGVLLETFPKLTSKNGYLKFKNFSSLHNYVGKSQGVPKVLPRDVLDKNRIDKKRIDKIHRVYLAVKGWKEENLESRDYARNYKAIKALVSRAEKSGGGDELVVQSLEWMSKQDYQWTLETVDKKWQDFLARGKVDAYKQLQEKYGL